MPNDQVSQKGVTHRVLKLTLHSEETIAMDISDAQYDALPNLCEETAG